MKTMAKTIAAHFVVDFMQHSFVFVPRTARGFVVGLFCIFRVFLFIWLVVRLERARGPLLMWLSEIRARPGWVQRLCQIATSSCEIL
jgi:hypothetical protein